MTDLKTCRKCGQEKTLEQFSKAGAGCNSFHGVKQQYKTTCKACDAEYAREFRKKNKNYKGSGKINKYSPEERLTVSAIGQRLNDAKQRIKKYNQIPTDLDRDWLYELFKKQEGKCALSGVKLRIEKHEPATLSLDKIDPNKGYIKGNVQWLAWAVNRAKGDMDTEVFLDMCRQITEKCND